MNAETERVHREIEMMVAGMIDLHQAGKLPAPDEETKAIWKKENLTTNVRLLNVLGDEGIEFQPGQGATVGMFEGERSPELILASVAVFYAAFSRGRSLEKCLHLERDPKLMMTKRSMIDLGVRFWSCVECADSFMAKALPRKAEIEADKHCDICLQEASFFKPYIFPVGGTCLVSFHAGECCDDLFSYAKPDAEYTKTPRNSPCPCGSGQKFKYCHGAPSGPGRWGQGKAQWS